MVEKIYLVPGRAVLGTWASWSPGLPGYLVKTNHLEFGPRVFKMFFSYMGGVFCSYMYMFFLFITRHPTI